MKRLNKKGQGLVEYILIVAIVAVGAMGVLRLMGHSVSGKFADITNSIQGSAKPKVHLEEVTSDVYKKRDMSDFMKNSSGEQPTTDGF